MENQNKHFAELMAQKENTTRPCLHDLYDEQLVKSMECKTIEEARKKIRYLSCNCPKCSPQY